MDKQRHTTNIVREGDGKLLAKIKGIIPVYPGEIITIKRVGQLKSGSPTIEVIVREAGLGTDTVAVIQTVIVDFIP